MIASNQGGQSLGYASSETREANHCISCYITVQLDTLGGES